MEKKQLGLGLYPYDMDVFCVKPKNNKKHIV